MGKKYLFEIGENYSEKLSKILLNCMISCSQIYTDIFGDFLQLTSNGHRISVEIEKKIIHEFNSLEKEFKDNELINEIERQIRLYMLYVWRVNYSQHIKF